MSDLSAFAFSPEPSTDPHSGVFLLWHDVLDLAIEDLSLHPMNIESSHRWFLSNSTEIGSFLWICNTVGGNPDYLRKKHKKQLDRVLDTKHVKKYKN